MINVVSIKFKNRGKCYFFDPNGFEVRSGDKVIVETSKGLEIADCSYGVHAVEDTAVVQPLRPVVRIATKDDLRVAEINAKREKEAFDICQKKISEHELDMKLVDVECNFEGNKTTFFFTSDGRVDFRELVKDLAGIFRNRIELRQIGVRDEAKMLGGIGICGRPYCCSQFLDEFQPVSTKMAKVQSLSLNPTKISGSCGRLMCCLRYEQDAYEDLLKKVPKQGAFVETIDGYGTAEQINLLRQTVKVKLDSDSDDALHLYKAAEVATVPGGRPRDGEPLPSVLKYVPPVEEDDDVATVNASGWEIPAQESAEAQPEERRGGNRRRRPRQQKADKPQPQKAEKPETKAEKPADEQQKKPRQNRHRNVKVKKSAGAAPETPAAARVEKAAAPEAAGGENKPRKHYNNRRYYRGKPKGKPAGGEKKSE